MLSELTIDRNLALQKSAASIQRQDDIAVGVAVLAGTLVYYAACSWLTST